MCLGIIYRGKEKREALAKLPESGYYYKSVIERKDGYYPPIMILPGNRPYRVGWNNTKKRYDDAGYALCFHLYRKQKTNHNLIRCIIKKKDIVAIGTQFGELVIVTKRFWMPKPKKKIAKYKKVDRE